MEIILIILVFIFGIIFGSFANVVIYRLPNELSLGGRSACPNCKKQLGFWELWPIFSFIFLGRKCKNCKKSISWRYFLVEILMGLLFVFAWVWVSPIVFLQYLFLIKLLSLIFFSVIVFAIDWEHFLIMDSVVLIFSLIFIVLNLTTDFFGGQGYHITLFGLLGAVCGSLPFYLIWLFSKGKLMGFGDVKLMLALGLVLGFPMVFVGVFVAVILGGILSMVLLAFGKAGLKTALPFGCFLSVGSLVALLYGQSLLSWYLLLIGVG